MIITERVKMERTVVEAKRQVVEDVLVVINQQEDFSEVRVFFLKRKDRMFGFDFRSL